MTMAWIPPDLCPASSISRQRIRWSCLSLRPDPGRPGESEPNWREFLGRTRRSPGDLLFRARPALDRAEPGRGAGDRESWHWDRNGSLFYSLINNGRVRRAASGVMDRMPGGVGGEVH
ncbi:hypothetical protein AAFF_G00167600 [Aldrovandia affinis]|uniref:Uncharacterized protein n=1 Tax=Aldrovandia affinis TaxID=143900 RepID=A0AAD7RM03_9TELE|nr:hypothetical protein AAFF_G00167600 [Aldrovandia affinis]